MVWPYEVIHGGLSDSLVIICIMQASGSEHFVIIEYIGIPSRVSFHNEPGFYLLFEVKRQIHACIKQIPFGCENPGGATEHVVQCRVRDVSVPLEISHATQHLIIQIHQFRSLTIQFVLPFRNLAKSTLYNVINYHSQNHWHTLLVC